MKNLQLATAAATAVLSSMHAAALPTYIKVGGIDGESRFDASAQSWQWLQALASRSFDGTRPARAGGVFVATGDLDGDTRWTSVLLEVVNTAPGDTPYFNVRLHNVRVTAGAALPGGGGQTLELTDFTAATITWWPLLPSGGRGDPLVGQWDVASGVFSGDRGVLGGLDELRAVTGPDGSVLITSAVPEPATWPSMLAGLALGGLLRRRTAPAALKRRPLLWARSGG